MGDVLSARGFPLAGLAVATFAYALNVLVPKRMKSAAEIWVEVVGRDWGALSEEQKEELVSIVDTFLQIARKGAAKANLRLLARIVAGQKAREALRADEFMTYASVLEGLSVEEIEALAVLYKTWKEHARDQAQIIRDEIRKQLIPKLAANNEELGALYEGIARTGLLVRINDLYDFSGFKPSKKFDQLVSLASFEDLFKAEMA